MGLKVNNIVFSGKIHYSLKPNRKSFKNQTSTIKTNFYGSSLRIHIRSSFCNFILFLTKHIQSILEKRNLRQLLIEFFTERFESRLYHIIDVSVTCKNIHYCVDFKYKNLKLIENVITPICRDIAGVQIKVHQGQFVVSSSISLDTLYEKFTSNFTSIDLTFLNGNKLRFQNNSNASYTSATFIVKTIGDQYKQQYELCCKLCDETLEKKCIDFCHEHYFVQLFHKQRVQISQHISSLLRRVSSTD